MNLYQKFFENKLEQEKDFVFLGEQIGVDFRCVLEKKTTEEKFLSTLNEFKLGLFFKNLCEKMIYDTKAFPNSRFTPDWVLHLGEERIVAEVFRLYSSKIDSEEQELSSKLINTIALISADYCVELNYSYQRILLLKIDYECILERVESWLNIGREVGESLILYDEIEVKISKKNQGNTTVACRGNINIVNFDFRRLSGANSRLSSKLKYAEIAFHNDMPFIICVHLSFETWFNPQDLYQDLYGLSAEFDNEEPWEEYYPHVPYHDMGTGLYYKEKNRFKFVSGIILYYQNNYSFFPNYSSVNKLSNRVLGVLTPYLYEELKT